MILEGFLRWRTFEETAVFEGDLSSGPGDVAFGVLGAGTGGHAGRGAA